MSALARSIDPNTTSYSNVALPGGKEGVLRKLDKGYYEIILGAFAAFGNGGWLYDVGTAKRYIENDREFLETLRSGQLRGEWGHPVRQPGMSDREWFVRICSVVEATTALQIRRIRLSYDTVKDERGRFVVAVIGEVRPSGMAASSYREMLENPDEDVNHSIRSFANKNFSSMTKHITRIITWDFVNTPGILVASKYKTPSLESKSSVAALLDSAEFRLDRIRTSIEEEIADNEDSFESYSPFVKIIDSLYEETRTQIALPKTLLWGANK